MSSQQDDVIETAVCQSHVWYATSLIQPWFLFTRVLSININTRNIQKSRTESYNYTDF